MKKFNITVSGKTYEVEVEEVGAVQAQYTNTPMQQAPGKQTIQEAPKPQPTTEAPKTKTAAKTAPQAQGEGQLITAPMPGTILDVKVSEGQTVKSGQVLLILEAMKMENEIVAPIDGVISKVYTSKSNTVSSGDALISID